MLFSLYNCILLLQKLCREQSETGINVLWYYIYINITVYIQYIYIPLLHKFYGEQ